MNRKLAIKGHATRGNEVIEILEMMGGKNCHNLTGHFAENAYYLIGGPHNDEILGGEYMFGNEDIYWFTLEEFLKKYPFKVGDKVKDCYEESFTIEAMSWFNDCETMVYTFEESDVVLTAEDLLKWTEKEGMEEKDKAKAPDLKGEDYSGKRFGYKIPDGYEFDMILNGEIFLKPIKPKYPDNYDECVRIAKNIHGYDIHIDTPAYRELMESFVKLLICRDAYWKIAGEEMGLDEPWEPDWNDLNRKYFISLTCNGIGLYDDFRNPQVLVFPTAEMRDAFYENFKKEIEQCKELL